MIQHYKYFYFVFAALVMQSIGAAEYAGLTSPFRLLSFSPPSQLPEPIARAQELQAQDTQLVKENLMLTSKCLCAATFTDNWTEEDWAALKRANKAILDIKEQTWAARRKIWAEADRQGITYSPVAAIPSAI